MSNPRQGQGAVIKLVDIFPHGFYVNMIFLHYWLILKSRTEKLKTDYNILEPPQIVCLILWNVWVTHHHHGAWLWGQWTEARCWWDVVIACWQNDPVCPVMVTRPNVPVSVVNRSIGEIVQGAVHILRKHFYRLVQHRMYSILLCVSL